MLNLTWATQLNKNITIKPRNSFKKMELIENNLFWIDNNNNSWSKSLYNKEQAIKFSESLINCINCSNCINCKDCTECENCTECSNCNNCIKCVSCINCSFSSNCYKLGNCRYCNDCFECYKCTDCLKCINCSECSKCTNCSRSKNLIKIEYSYLDLNEYIINKFIDNYL